MLQIFDAVSDEILKRMTSNELRAARPVESEAELYFGRRLFENQSPEIGDAGDEGGAFDETESL